ncbi:MAG: hypothetical protein PHF86_04030 [Candidatus Nanoarchaeia archaeon]|jgi:hypothetical protein|nr:hypothetical protein [Candidatus Nanoarchaeia archaeon]
MKLKVTLSGGKIREFNLNRINIVPSPPVDGPVMLNMNKSRENNGTYDMFVTSNLLPAVDLLEKIEIVE